MHNIRCVQRTASVNGGLTLKRFLASMSMDSRKSGTGLRILHALPTLILSEDYQEFVTGQTASKLIGLRIRILVVFNMLPYHLLMQKPS